jgi:hypothetical protein
VISSIPGIPVGDLGKGLGCCLVRFAGVMKMFTLEAVSGGAGHGFQYLIY